MTTETIDPRYVDIDTWATVDAVAAMLAGQRRAVAAIETQVAAIAAAADAAARRLDDGTGRLVYVGAGTSGRVAVQDGVELGPTFGWPETRLRYLMAGGMVALATSAEGAEDDAEGARLQIAAHGLGPHDVVIGVAASGRTPFTLSALEAARLTGAMTIGIANNPDTPILAAAEHAILADTGAEVLAGSTRMQAGTAQKIVLNMVSTAVMLRLGRVYRGLMVDMVISNAKLLGRAHAIVQRLTDCGEADAVRAVAAAEYDIKRAVLIALGMGADQAAVLLTQHRQRLRPAIEAMGAG